MATSGLQPSAPDVSPQQVLDVTCGFAATQIVSTALELDLFSCLDEGHATIDDISRETGSSTRGLRILLDALVGMKYLDKTDSRYALAPIARAYLSRRSPSYLGGLVLHSRQLQANWARLTGVVRTGRTPHAVESEEDHGEFFAQFVDALYALHNPSAVVAAEALCSNGNCGRRVLDIGAGSAVWSLAFARRDPQARVTVLDWPSVVERVTKKCVAREGASSRYSYLPGNFRKCDFGESAFEVAILGHICHSEGAARTQHLLTQVYRALKPGGHVLIAEVIPDDERRAAAYPLLFAVNMLVNTEEGDTFTLAQYRQWLEAAGFHQVRTLEAPSPSPLIVASKPR
jgi:ubiquinone/menaquinone biosynthesis C-methylase UbiE